MLQQMPPKRNGGTLGRPDGARDLESIENGNA